MHPAARIIDAAANRAREALRVMEDIARFVLDDADLCATLKNIRHDLAAALFAAIDHGELLVARDTPHDVGASISTAAEHQRANLAQVAAAASKRLAEALRSLEECSKIPSLSSPSHETSPPKSEALESLRYRAYDAEKRLLLALGAGRARQWTLCVLITESLCEHHSWEDVARDAIEGGADCLQLREKALPDRELLRRARRLVAIARESPSPSSLRASGPPGLSPQVIINDRPDIALLSGADGVHLGQEDLDVHDVRRLAGFSLLVGVSTTNLEHALAAARAGADYCGVGPMFPTTTKDKPHIAGPDYLSLYLRTAAVSRLPHLAIGGITPANIAQLASAGCRGVAVSSSVCKEQRPAVACRALRDGLAPTH